MKSSRLPRFIVAGLAAAALSATVAAHDYRVGDIELLHPWVRLPPPVSSTAAGYLVLRNNGASVDRLLDIGTDLARRSEMHASTMNDGVMTMQRMDAIEVPAHGEVRFAPGGLHIMLTGLETRLEDGDSVAMTLRFEHAGELSIEFVVQRGETTDHGRQ